jgi:hypothetical protein
MRALEVCLDALFSGGNLTDQRIAPPDLAAFLYLRQDI